MKTDRELLELAAKAAGLRISIMLSNDGLMVCSAVGKSPHKWNPLTDDGDALRLANALDMSIEISGHEESTYCYAGNVPRAYAVERWKSDKSLTTRRVIVRAAAALGETL